MILCGVKNVAQGRSALCTRYCCCHQRTPPMMSTVDVPACSPRAQSYSVPCKCERNASCLPACLPPFFPFIRMGNVWRYSTFGTTTTRKKLFFQVFGIYSIPEKYDVVDNDDDLRGGGGSLNARRWNDTTTSNYRVVLP